jgi:dipeptidyl aminopeptidase/acylaminoacyl peptidase
MGGQWLGRSTVAIVALGLSAEAVLAETLVGPTPEIFAPGVVSAGANDGAPTFSPDGRTLYFERTNSKWTAILESRLTPRGWTKPVLAAFSGETSDQQPSLSPDGRYLVFVSSRPLPAAEAAPPRFANHLYRVDRLANGWSKARELPATVNLSNRVFKPSVAANGDLYFMADVGPGGAPKWRLFFARAVGQSYAPAQALPFSGSEDGDVDPFIAPDQSYLVFSSNTRGALKDGHEHLFMVRREGAGWSAIRPLRYAGDDLGQDDGEAQVGPDGRWLYFTSSRIIPMAKVHDRQTAQRALERMNVWDNSNGNAWRLPLATLIAAERL